MAMAALSCTGLPVTSSLAASHIECSTSAYSVSRDVKPSASVSRAAMEPCVVCMPPSASASRIPLGLGKTTGLYGSHRIEDRSRYRLQIVQQAAPPTVSFTERNFMKNLETGTVPELSGTQFFSAYSQQLVFEVILLDQ